MRQIWSAPIVGLLSAIALVAAGCGGDEEPGGGTAATTTAARGTQFSVVMTEMKFTPSSFIVKAGDTVTFTFRNEGTVDHEGVIGDEAFQLMHEQEMAEGEEMMGKEDEVHVHVEPGQTKTLKYTFAEPGTLLIGCHEPGHWTAGMRATITVEA